MEYFISLVLLGFIFFQWKKGKNSRAEEIYKNYLSTEEFKRTLAFGIYQRFCKENEEKSYSSTFIKNDPLEFEHFIADILKHKYGGNIYVTKSSGDFGVDIEHGVGEGKVLGQVKCYKDDVGYEPIALLHSNIVKQNASKGYVVTTSNFTDNARSYAEGLSIDLITGTDLVEMWLNYSNPLSESIIVEPIHNQTTNKIDTPI
ncbi:restriction endonuclease [Bacillus canaveralius]|uniref:Restriction endonuclease n=1 Tax=Bacillus canaveralius TaxID=1403243 RepID=A0A2N5GN14_9BACI|nr:restriction endonuclease [Bacillus canaveralius]PLR83476.1 restriction endonuclease [Bacillus canaveralius]PLR95343.1 restriction endonuclease [Bacillus canaveralius]